MHLQKMYPKRVFYNVYVVHIICYNRYTHHRKMKSLMYYRESEEYALAKHGQ